MIWGTACAVAEVARLFHLNSHGSAFMRGGHLKKEVNHVVQAGIYLGMVAIALVLTFRPVLAQEPRTPGVDNRATTSAVNTGVTDEDNTPDIGWLGLIGLIGLGGLVRGNRAGEVHTDRTTHR